MGRPPKPTALKMVHGDDKYRINQNEPVPSRAKTLEPPPLSPRATELWTRLAPDLAAKKVLTDWDRETLANYCSAQWRAEEANADLERNGTTCTTLVKTLRDGTEVYELRKNPAFLVWKDSVALTIQLGAQLGLTPAARTKITTKGSDAKKEGADLLTA